MKRNLFKDWIAKADTSTERVAGQFESLSFLEGATLQNRERWRPDRKLKLSDSIPSLPLRVLLKTVGSWDVWITLLKQGVGEKLRSARPN